MFLLKTNITSKLSDPLTRTMTSNNMLTPDGVCLTDRSCVSSKCCWWNIALVRNTLITHNHTESVKLPINQLQMVPKTVMVLISFVECEPFFVHIQLDGRHLVFIICMDSLYKVFTLMQWRSYVKNISQRCTKLSTYLFD